MKAIKIEIVKNGGDIGIKGRMIKKK